MTGTDPICPSCGTVNRAGRSSCEVCGATLVGTVADVAPSVPVAQRIAAGDAGPTPGAGPNRPVAAAPASTPGGAPAGRSNLGRNVAIVCVVVLVAVAVGAGAYLGARSSDPDAPLSSSATTATASVGASSGGAGGTSQPDGSAPVVSVAPSAPTTEGASSVPRPSGDPCVATPSAVTGTTTFTDDAHVARLTIPTAFSPTQPFDGRWAEWTSGDATLRYWVDGGNNDAAARYQEVRASLTGTPCVDVFEPPPYTDGRYIISGFQADGTKVYERGRIRCNTLVWYRMTWRTESSHRLVAATAKLQVSDDPGLDALGGDYALCDE